MERLTKTIITPQREVIVYTKGKYEDTIGAEMEYQDIRKVLKRLARYEDAGLTPEQVHEMKEALSRENTQEFTRQSRDNDGWISVEERLPEEKKSVLVQWEKYDRHLNVTLTYLDVMWLDDAEEKVFETINGVPNGKVIAWRPLPEPYRPERSNDEKE